MARSKVKTHVSEKKLKTFPPGQSIFTTLPEQRAHTHTFSCSFKFLVRAPLYNTTHKVGAKLRNSPRKSGKRLSRPLAVVPLAPVILLKLTSSAISHKSLSFIASAVTQGDAVLPKPRSFEIFLSLILSLSLALAFSWPRGTRKVDNIHAKKFLTLECNGY